MYFNFWQRAALQTKLDPDQKKSIASLILHKSTIPANEPGVIQKAREMLSFGMSKAQVAAELGLSKRDWSNWLLSTWGPLE
jgi:hypothetical protein